MGDRPALESAKEMVDALRARGAIRSAAVEQAFLAVPRHRFLAPAPLGEVYAPDAVVPTHFGADGLPISSSSAPIIMATMLEQLEVRPGMRVLEIGSGTGYNAGLLAHLAGGGRVVSIDLDDDIVSEARAHLRANDLDRVEVRTGDGWLGAADRGPYDRIISTVGAREVSPHWFDQLQPGGVLVMPLWLRSGVQVSAAFVRDADGLRSESLYACGFMRLRGPHAGPDAHVPVPGWADRVDGATPDRQWIAALEDATPERVECLRALLAGPARAGRVPLPAAGWTTRLALEQPNAIGFSGRDAMYHFAYGLFDPDPPSLALFDAGLVVSFGDPACADFLRARLGAYPPLQLSDLDIRAERHPVGVVPGAWVLERPSLDLVVRERSR